MALLIAVSVMSTSPEASGGFATGEDYRMSAQEGPSFRLMSARGTEVGDFKMSQMRSAANE
jgi:hypothetical protein